MGRWLRFFGRCLAGMVVAVLTAWAALAVFYSNLPGQLLRGGLAAGLVLAVLLAFAFLPNRRRTLVGFGVGFALLVAWWMAIPASNDRAWQPDVAVLPYADVDGTRVTLHNIRNLHYRTETDFDLRYYDKTFDLERLDGVDLIAVYWMGDAIAHIMVSFGFGGRDFVTFSIETRKEQGEGYSTLKGFFKQYELIYIVGDERDLIRVRTDFRNPPEDVYLYRLRMPPERARRLFLSYVQKINQLRQSPEWYNTATTNCTTNVVWHVQAAGGLARYNWRVLLSGYAPQYAYRLGALDTRLPFEELRRRSTINPKARAAGDAQDFSVRIREGLPVSAQRP
jgi:hypothetical protein